MSKAFLVPKATLPGQPLKWRLVVDLRFLNSFCKEFKTSFETLKSLQHLARPDEWMISIDLEDGYHCIGIREQDQKYMTFCIQGQYYSCSALPFGWNGSPSVFCQVMKTLTRALRSPTADTQHGATSLLQKALLSRRQKRNLARDPTLAS